MKLFLLLMLIVGSLARISGQIDTSFIQIVPDVKVFAIHSTVKNFRVSFRTDVSEKISFQNSDIGIGLKIKYKRIGLSGSIPVISLNQTDFGNPRSLGLGLNFYPTSYFIQAEYRHLKGFDDLQALKNGSNEVFRAQDRMNYLSITGHYIFNSRRFSLRSAFRMVNRQKRSAGSWILAVPITYQHFRSDSLRLPLENKPDFQMDLYRSFLTGIGGGYAYSLVKGDWSANILATGGLEFRHLQYRNEMTHILRNRFLISPRLRLMSSIVYNTPVFFAGLVGRFLPGVEVADGLNTRVENWRVRIIVGKRLTPKR